MMGSLFSASRESLNRIIQLRFILIVAEIFLVLVAHQWFELLLPLEAIGIVIVLMTLVNLLSLWRLKIDFPFTEVEIFVQLVIDVLSLSVLIYYCGGSTNPFVSLYLVPLVVATVALNKRYTWLMCGLVIGCYSLLVQYYQPLLMRGDSQHLHHLHLRGMWLNFIISGLLITFISVRIRESLRAHGKALAKARADSARDENLVGLGMVAVGAMHELGTPLSTMSVLANELKREYADDPNLAENLDLLNSQIKLCKTRLNELLEATGRGANGAQSVVSIDQFFIDLLDRWRIMRPAVSIDKSNINGPKINIYAELSIEQAVINFLDNAADVSPHNVEMEVNWDQQWIHIGIHDRGPGLTDELARNVGKAFFTTKLPGKGMGIGLYLANASVERIGGNVELYARLGGGLTIQIKLPVNALLGDTA
ncbi:MAG: HAMP domain-containing histidine kinase [Pseudomonadales bacterium]|nr:HAMP domain-containing histidine kinase [Pseudomonadales bacterium]